MNISAIAACSGVVFSFRFFPLLTSAKGINIDRNAVLESLHCLFSEPFLVQVIDGGHRSIQNVIE